MIEDEMFELVKGAYYDLNDEFKSVFGYDITTEKKLKKYQKSL